MGRFADLIAEARAQNGRPGTKVDLWLAAQNDEIHGEFLTMCDDPSYSAAELCRAMKTLGFDGCVSTVVGWRNARRERG